MDNVAVAALEDGVRNPIERSLSILELVRSTAASSETEVDDNLGRIQGELHEALDTLSSVLAQTALERGSYKLVPSRMKLGEVFLPSRIIKVHYAYQTNAEMEVEVDPIPLRVAARVVKNCARHKAGMRVHLRMALDRERLKVEITTGFSKSRAAKMESPPTIDMIQLMLSAADIKVLEACMRGLGGELEWPPSSKPDPSVFTIHVANLRMHVGRFGLQPQAEEPHALALPNDATILVVDDSRLSRSMICRRVLTTLCVTGIEPTPLPPMDLRDSDKRAIEALENYEKTLSRLVRKGRVLLLSDEELGEGIKSGSEVIRSVREKVAEAETNLVSCVVTANAGHAAYEGCGVDVIVSKAPDGFTIAQPAIAQACARRWKVLPSMTPVRKSLGRPGTGRTASAQVL
mmetsp:Transcript_9726/g.28509  ORF Transcript_9726/g.28509 Transcript_9726/m.28509 type:complete len:404 (+) Transcript_9726:92-1303(+)